MPNPTRPSRVNRTGWRSLLARVTMAWLVLETLTGLAVTFGPFHPAIQWSVLVHTLAGAVLLAPAIWYCVVHWLDYKEQAVSDVVLLGYAGAVSILACCVSGSVVTVEALAGIRTSAAWRNVHLVSTFVLLAAVGAHAVLAFVRSRKFIPAEAVPGFLRYVSGFTTAGIALTAIIALAVPGTRYVNQFPKDYSYLYGKGRPFAPSLARTSTGGAFDARSLSGSTSCGTAGCHAQILEEWKPSAHRYSAMDSIFQGIQTVMAKQNGAESTRYCGRCHDPMSLFSGTKNISVEKLTGLDGYNARVSCLACHAIQKTDIQGNANFTVVQPRPYLWQWSAEGAGRVARDFLIRAYPAEHLKLSKRMYKAPEYCAACHKQFIDQEVNRVGWVQLQNQYDNWRKSRWNHPGDPKRTVECRECHMPLASSTDPGAGDDADYNRTPNDGKHRGHRFLGANQFIPLALDLVGAKQHVALTERWLRGEIDVPEIAHKWRRGSAVPIELHAPDTVVAGRPVVLRAQLT